MNYKTKNCKNKKKQANKKKIK